VARLGLRSDTRGVVYVEFLIAFFPLLLMFLAVCQLALIASAHLIVQHAALATARSAIVLLEDSPDEFGGAKKGELTTHPGEAKATPETALRALGVDVPETSSSSWLGGTFEQVSATADARPQQGARMQTIRTAGYLPLLALAPRPDTLGPSSDPSLGDSLPAGFESRFSFGLRWSRAASVITLHDIPGTEELAAEPIDHTAPVTVRVTYLFQCAVPFVRALLCDTLASLLALPNPLLGGTAAGEARAALVRRLQLAEAPGDLVQLAAAGSRFTVLTAETTLPNQGAAYTFAEKKEGS
jgi:hypothetical protein